MFWPCETRTSTCRSFATISSGLYRFLAIAVLLDVKDIPQVGPLQWGWITAMRPDPPSCKSTARHNALARGFGEGAKRVMPDRMRLFLQRLARTYCARGRHALRNSATYSKPKTHLDR